MKIFCKFSVKQNREEKKFHFPSNLLKYLPKLSFSLHSETKLTYIFYYITYLNIGHRYLFSTDFGTTL